MDNVVDINKLNDTFIMELTDNNCFMLDWHEGAVLPKTHPHYYDGRVNIKIRKDFNESYGNINFDKDEYQVTDDITNKLYSYVEQNIDKFIKLALNQNAEMYEGVVDNLSIKYKTIYIRLSELNTITLEDKIVIRKIKEDLKNIILSN